jgi:urease accessory protein
VTPAVLLLADGRFPVGGHAHSAGVETACADGRVADESSLQEFLEGRLQTAGLVDASLAAATVLALADPVADVRRSATDTDACDRPQPPAPNADQCRDLVDADMRVEWGEATLLLDREAEARIAAPPLRAASRQLGRQLVRVGRRCWPHGALACIAGTVPAGPHQPVAWGAVGFAAGCDVDEVARLVVHHALTTPAQAAVRLLGLDPFAVAAVTAHLGPLAEQVAADAVRAVRRALSPRVSLDGDHGLTTGLDLAGWASGLADLPALASPLVEVAAVEHAAWDVRMFAT